MTTTVLYKKFKEFILRNHPPIIVFGGIYLILFYFFNPHLIFSTATPTGGDMGSHYYNALYASKAFLKNPTVFNWDFNWFAGYPPFIFYFPLTFVLITILNLLLPLTIAFKLIVVSGTFLLPLAVFYLIKSFRLKNYYGYLGAMLSLIFLFNSNMQSSAQIWGGTVMSVLAGEFAQSLSIVLGLFFVGSFYRMLDSEEKKLWPALLLGLTLLAHPLSFIWVSLVAFTLFLYKFSKINLKYFLKIIILVFLIDAFWLIPTLIYKKDYFLNLASVWTTRFQDILPESIIFWPIFLIPGLLNGKKRHFDFAFFLAAGAGLAFLLSKMAVKIGIYPVRFYPYLQLVFVLSGVFVASLFNKKTARLGILLSLLAIGYFTIAYRSNPITSWVKWNFEGLEAKENFKYLKEANDSIRGSLNDPRALIEFSSENNDTGTPRNNELVPLLAGRQTLEGLYMFSSITNPFIFKLQSEVSADKSCQTDVIGLKCGDIDYDLAVKHLKLFNIDHIIVRSQKVNALLAKRQDFKKENTFGPYTVWQFLDNDNKYIFVPKFQPTFYTGTEDWKKVSFDWFNNPNSLDQPIIFKATQKDLIKTKISSTPINQNCSITETLSTNTIKFKTSCLGLPHIIKVSYFPAWHVEGASKIYLVSPSFMLVYPEKEEVTLRFGGGLANNFLKGLTLISLLTIIYTLLPKKYNLLR